VLLLDVLGLHVSSCHSTMLVTQALSVIQHIVFFAQILPVVVGVRQYSARLEMFRQLAKQLDPAQVTHSMT
jgi:hypothetical protein